MEEKNNNQPSGGARLNPVELLEHMKTTSADLDKKIQILTLKANSLYKLTMEATDTFDDQIKELKKNAIIQMGIAPEDLKKLESYRDYFKHYKPVLYISLLVIISGWGLGLFGAYSGFKYYKESIRSKQETRNEILQEIDNKGGTIVSKEQWEDYQEQNKILKAWEETNSEGSRSLKDYANGYKAKQRK